MSSDSLWRSADFNRLWLAQGTSFLGSQVTALALPLTAVLLLNASPMEMGILGASAFAPFLMLGLFAGVYIDRRNRRPILIAADLGRAGLLILVPLAAFLGMLRLEYLYLIQFLVGTLTVFFDVAHEAYLPSVVAPDQLIEGNSKLEVTRSIAFVSGPSLAGGLIQLLTAPATILVNISSFLASAYFLFQIKKPEHISFKKNSESVWKEIREGLRFILGNRFLRPLVARTATANLFDRVMQAVYLLYVTRDLMIEPVALGFLFSTIGIGALVGALTAGWLARLIGVGRVIIAAAILGGGGSLLFPLAGESVKLTLPLLVAGHFFLGMSIPIYNINQISLRQAITPDHLRGRVTASGRFLTWGPLPIGWLLGGVLGELFGLRPTLLIGATGVMLGTLWVLLSPVRTLQRVTDVTASDLAPSIA
jgi:MFS family permease